jgi:hypothetical protein
MVSVYKAKRVDALVEQTKAFLASAYGAGFVQRMRGMGLDDPFILRSAIQKACRNLSGEEITEIYNRLRGEEGTMQTADSSPQVETAGKQFTARQLSNQFECSVKTIHNHANSLFGEAENGKQRRFNESQATAILESIKKTAAEHRGKESVDLERSVQGQETELSPILRLTVLRREMEAIYQGEIKRLQGELKKSQAAREREAARHEELLTAIETFARKNRERRVKCPEKA